MHRDHDHHHHGGESHSHSHDHTHGPGHNHHHHPRKPAQWQTPHLPDAPPIESAATEPDLDLVELAFVEAFAVTSDPTSFLRLAQVPFEAKAADGVRVVLLRVETDVFADVGSVTPHVGGGSFRYDPLPAALVGKRRRLRFIYADGKTPRVLSLGEVRSLSPL